MLSRRVLVLLVSLSSPCLPGAALAGPLDLSGVWDVKLDIAGHATDYRLELEQKGESVRGNLVSPRSKNRYPTREGTWKESTLRIEIPKQIPLRGEVIFQVVARPVGQAGDHLEGTIQVEGIDPGKFVARRRPALAGAWRTLARLSEGREIEARMEVTELDGKLKGTATGTLGSVELKSIGLSDSGVVNFSLILSGDSGDREYVVRASFDGPDRLKGRWSAADESSSGEWTARRETPPRAAAGSLAGRYRLTATGPEGGSLEVDFHPRLAAGKVTGHLQTREGDRFDVRSGSFQEGKLEFEVEKKDGVRVKVKGVMGESGVLKGTWVDPSSSGEWTARPVEEV